MDTAKEFDAWAIVEVMGFKKYAGHVTTQEIAGASFIRVDVPEIRMLSGEYTPGLSKLIGSGSIYMITPTDEATARKAARVLSRQDSPLPVYIPPEPRQLSGPIPSQHSLDEEGDWGEEFPANEVDEQLSQDALDEMAKEADIAQEAERAKV